jgi:hypothetical protein
VLNKLRSMYSRLCCGRDRRPEHELYGQREASRYRTMHESRQDGDLPV